MEGATGQGPGCLLLLPGGSERPRTDAARDESCRGVGKAASGKRVEATQTAAGPLPLASACPALDTFLVELEC